VNNAFWLVADFQLPHINIARSSGSINVGNYWANGNINGKPEKNEAKISLDRYGKDYYIYSLEWLPGKLTWKINGVTIKTVTDGVPQTPMFINLGSSLYKAPDDSVLPASFEVDWVRCYKEK